MSIISQAIIILSCHGIYFGSLVNIRILFGCYVFVITLIADKETRMAKLRCEVYSAIRQYLCTVDWLALLFHILNIPC